VNQAHTQDLIENLHSGNLARTQDKRFLQKEAVSLNESPSQNVAQPTPTSEEIFLKIF